MYKVKKAKNDQYYWGLIANNNESLCTSEMYVAKQSVLNGIDAMRRASNYEVKTSTNGKWFWVAKAGNHQILATSEMYESAQAAEKGIAAAKSLAANATLDDQT